MHKEITSEKLNKKIVKFYYRRNNIMVTRIDENVTNVPREDIKDQMERQIIFIVKIEGTSEK